MNLVGSCYICSKPAMYSCSYCGRVSCIDHYIKDKRMCTKCQAKMGDSFNDDHDPQEILF